jgi:hypothetical protein
MRLFKLIDIEMLFAVEFVSHRETHYKIQYCGINKENVQMKLFIYM